MAISVLGEIKDLPAKVTNPDWLEEIEEPFEEERNQARQIGAFALARDEIKPHVLPRSAGLFSQAFGLSHELQNNKLGARRVERSMKTRILVSLVAALFAVGFSGLSVSYAGELE